MAAGFGLADEVPPRVGLVAGVVEVFAQHPLGEAPGDEILAHLPFLHAVQTGEERRGINVEQQRAAGAQAAADALQHGLRVAQETPDPIRNYVEQDCLVTDDGRFVAMVPPVTISARLGTAKAMDTKAYRAKASEIKKAIAAMEPDVAAPHMALLINSMYSDEYKDDAYQRIQYLRLCQSLAEVGETGLNYQGNIRQDNVAVAGKKTLRELTNYRDDIAHWWTDTIDENFLADLQRTIYELMRRRYFYRIARFWP